MIGIYAGEGASHSWTWFVTVMEKLGINQYRFLTGGDIREGRLEDIQAVFIGGGDVEGIARELGEKGAEKLKAFLRGGGVYFGSCAGAYLVMREVDREPYRPFDLIEAGFSNYHPSPPSPLNLPHKYKVRYGDGFVYHLAYGPVRVGMEGPPRFAGLGDLTVALYGGPVIAPRGGSQVLSRYRGLEKGCVSMVEDALIRETLIGGVAGVRAEYYGGMVYIFGPHFECPYFPQGFRLLEAVLREENIYEMLKLRRGERVSEGRHRFMRRPSWEWFKDVKRELSNARIAARGLENAPVFWELGTKVWGPEKIIYFVEFLWSRLPGLEKSLNNGVPEERLEHLVEMTASTSSRIRELKRDMEDGKDTLEEAEELFRHLREHAVSFLELVRGEVEVRWR